MTIIKTLKMEDIKELAKHNRFTNYVRESFQELTKVTWPTKNQAVRLTAIVLGFCLAFAIFLAGVDYAASTGYTEVLKLSISSRGAISESAPISVPASGETSVPVTVPSSGETSVPVTVPASDGTSIPITVPASGDVSVPISIPATPATPTPGS